MSITQEQSNLLAGFHSERINHVDVSLVQSIMGAVIDGRESQLARIFKQKRTFSEDGNDVLASYVILTPNNDVLGFYSLRCGELYKSVDLRKMEICQNAWEALQKLTNTPNIADDERRICINSVREAINIGVSSPDEIQQYATKNARYHRDKTKWSDHNIAQVSAVFPAVELKLFGLNENARAIWNSYNLPQRFGETLFWHDIINQIEIICDCVGCQFVYLFAADKEPDGELVNYYQTRLHFTVSSDMNANKPNFDFNCRFMYQEVETLKKYRDYFFAHFNTMTSR